jgi:hypothetical protein
MKASKILTLLLFTFVLAVSAVAQGQGRGKGRDKAPGQQKKTGIAETEVPQAVRDAYAKDFAGVAVLRWERKGKQGKHYVAVLEQNGMRHRARYTDAGEAVHHTSIYPADKVPSTVSGATLSANPGFKLIRGLEIKNKKKGTTIWHLILRKDNMRLTANVNPDGSAVSKDKVPAEVTEEGEDNKNDD